MFGEVWAPCCKIGRKPEIGPRRKKRFDATMSHASRRKRSKEHVRDQFDALTCMTRNSLGLLAGTPFQLLFQARADAQSCARLVRYFSYKKGELKTNALVSVEILVDAAFTWCVFYLLFQKKKKRKKNFFFF